MKLHKAILPLLLASAGTALAGPAAESAPALGNTAVSEPNGKLDIGYANLDSEEAWLLGGSFSMPIADSYGFQLDGLFTDAEDTDFTGIGGHLFWRDHEVGLLGITAGGVFGSDVDAWEAGVEAEYYMNEWLTIGARAGYADIEFDTGPFFADADDDGFYGLLYLTAYATEDLAITVSVASRFDRTAYSIGAEYDLPVKNLTATAEAMWGEDDYDHVMFGLRYYFGSEKSLRDRHRTDDPPNLLYGLVEPSQRRPDSGEKREREECRICEEG